MGGAYDGRGVLVVGASHAGTATVVALREYGFAGPVTLVGQEDHLPYHRPPVSKTYLSADAQPDILRPAQWFAEHDVALRLGREVVSVDLHRAVLDDGSEIEFDDLVIATGARARRMPLPLPATGTWSLRTFAEAVAFRDQLCEGARIVVVGGGFIGLEVAAAARKAGADVTVVEREERLLQRIASPDLSGAATDYHRGQGVEVLLGASVAEVLGHTDGPVVGVRLDNGSTLPCDALVIGVGAEPCTELAEMLGAECDGGVVVDTGARTSVPHVFAVGDVTRREVHGHDGRHRLESIPNASEQGRQAAASIVGAAAPAPETPWFWSDQADFKIKIAGFLNGETTAVLRGDPVSGKFAVYHLDPSGRLVAVEAVNSGGDFMAGKKWIAANATLLGDRLGDPAVPLRELVPA